MSASGEIMTQDTCPIATPRSAARNRPPAGGYVTLGTLVLAAASALFLVAMSGCHSTPATNAFGASGADRATEARLQGP
jgi:hypothetical protein